MRLLRAPFPRNDSLLPAHECSRPLGLAELLRDVSDTLHIRGCLRRAHESRRPPPQALYQCETCPLTWWTPHERDQHQADAGHYNHLYCADCDRYFRNAGNLDQHRKFRLHQGTTVRCPFCSDTYVTASGLSAHIETSACPAARLLDRSKVWQFLRRRDPQGVFTERLLTYPGSDLSDYWDPCAAWNGEGYECYICHKAYQTPHGLRQHVTSPAHQAPIYHCPNWNGKCGGRRFGSLAAFFNHLESESCGYIKFGAVLEGVSHFFV